MVSAAEGRPLIEMGSRRTHEQAAVAAARAAYLAGFAGTSNLAAQRRYGVPTLGTSAHAFTLLHTTKDGPDEPAAFRSQVEALGVGTTLLVDTYDITAGVANAVAAAGPDLGAVRIDSGDLGVLARQVRAQLDALGATRTGIVVSGDLDEFAIAALRAEPVNSYGVGTSLVTGSGAPTAGMVYKLVEVDGHPVEKRSSHKESHGGRKQAHRFAKHSGTIVEEVVHPAGEPPAAECDLVARPLAVPLVRSGEPVADPGLAAARERVDAGLHSLPWDGLKLSRGEPAIPTRMVTLAGRSRRA
jgi:nicotinate phosphoribosyltransferase